MNKNILKEILQIPSYSTKENRVRDYIVEFAKEKEIPYIIDKFGNVFLKKGKVREGQGFPCVVSHMDTVHRMQSDLISTDINLDIIEKETDEGNILYAQIMRPSGVPISTGIGGDDKAGIFICLSLIEKFDVIMGAFFVEEEIGCIGSRKSKTGEGHKWLLDASYFIQFDAPTDNWVSRVCSGVELFDDNFNKLLKPVFEQYGLTKINVNDPFTDVKELKLNYPVCCINYFAGYMDMHTPVEYVVLEYVEKAINVGTTTIIELGRDKQIYKKKK